MNARGNGSCPNVQKPICQELGSIAVETGDQCVPEYQCVCDDDSSACPLPLNCSDIEYLHEEDGECCPQYECSKYRKCNLLMCKVYIQYIE